MHSCRAFDDSVEIAGGLCVGEGLDPLVLAPLANDVPRVPLPCERTVRELHVSVLVAHVEEAGMVRKAPGKVQLAPAAPPRGPTPPRLVTRIV